MSTQAVISLDEYRQANGIQLLMGQAWPKNRAKGDFRKERTAVAEAGLRITSCAFCGAESPPLDGPAGRAWFANHTSNGDCSQPVIV